MAEHLAPDLIAEARTRTPGHDGSVGARNETRLWRWERRVFIATGAVVAAQLGARLALDGTVEAVVTCSLWLGLVLGAALTSPVDGARHAPRRLRRLAALVLPNVAGMLLAQGAPLWPVTDDMGLGDALRSAAQYLLVGGGVLLTGAALAWLRVRRYRRGPRRTVALRVTPATVEPLHDTDGA